MLFQVEILISHRDDDGGGKITDKAAPAGYTNDKRLQYASLAATCL